jgi:uncharacterized protein YecE (DUF72 family)
MRGRVIVGTAGWTIPREYAARLPGAGTHLERYARRLHGVEIDSSFYRSHRRETYARWRASVPAGFRFAVKMPKAISHEARLRGVAATLEAFLAETAGLGQARGPLLLQLPPSLAYDARTARSFFSVLRRRYRGPAVCEPRHPSWFAPEVDALLREARVARVAADPPVAPGGLEPGGWPRLVYYRLHGSPRMYYSSYPDAFLVELAARLRLAAQRATVWCIFDNTAAGAALGNALRTVELLANAGGERPVPAGLKAGRYDEKNAPGRYDETGRRRPA